MEKLQERLALLETQKGYERRVESQTAEDAAELVDVDLEWMGDSAGCRRVEDEGRCC